MPIPSASDLAGLPISMACRGNSAYANEAVQPRRAECLRTGSRLLAGFRSSTDLPALLLKCDFGEASKLSRVEALALLRAQMLEGPQPNLEVLLDALAVEFAGHSRQLDFPVQRLIGNAQQRAVGHPKAEPVCGNGGRFHVERNGTRL